MKNSKHDSSAEEPVSPQEIPPGVLLYTKEQMAALLQVSVSTLERLMHQGSLTYLRLGYSLVRFHDGDAIQRLRQTKSVWKKNRAQKEAP